MNVLGIYREEIFSPGKVEADKEIMDKALMELGKLGLDFKAIHPESLSQNFEADIVLNMAQSEEVLSQLQLWENNGMKIINSVRSIRNCYRKKMISILKENQLTIPKSWVYNLEMIEREMFEIYSLGWIGSYWLKRGDFHAIDSKDVIKVNSFEEMEKGIAYFREKGIDEIVIQEHVDGDVIKFYGVGEEYIRAFILPDNKEISLRQNIKDMILRAKRCLGLDIYGGDVIMPSTENFFLIDINDWPSFSLCRDEAAKKIAIYTKRIMEDFDELSNRSKNGG